MRLLLVAGLVGAFLGLLGAAYLGEPAWRWALAGVMIGLSLAGCAALGLAAGRLLRPRFRAAAAGLACGVAAALTRQVLMAIIRARAVDAPPQIRPLSLLAAVFTVVGGVFALLWGCAALRRLAAPTDAPPARTWPDLLLGGGAVALGLYGVAPVGQALGLRVNLWTFLGLALLAVLAYAIEEIVGRLLDGSGGARRARRGAPRRP